MVCIQEMFREELGGHGRRHLVCLRKFSGCRMPKFEACNQVFSATIGGNSLASRVPSVKREDHDTFKIFVGLGKLINSMFF